MLLKLLFCIFLLSIPIHALPIETSPDRGMDIEGFTRITVGKDHELLFDEVGFYDFDSDNEKIASADDRISDFSPLNGPIDENELKKNTNIMELDDICLTSAGYNDWSPSYTECFNGSMENAIPTIECSDWDEIALLLNDNVGDGQGNNLLNGEKRKLEKESTFKKNSIQKTKHYDAFYENYAAMNSYFSKTENYCDHNDYLKQFPPLTDESQTASCSRIDANTNSIRSLFSVPLPWHQLAEQRDINDANIPQLSEDSINLKDGYGNTPLHIAVERNDISLVKFLLGRYASIFVINKGKFTPLMIAVKNNNLEMIRILMKYNSNLNITHQTLLHYAIRNCQTITIKALIECKILINTKDNYQKTPLHVAVSLGRSDVVKLLLDFGADLSITDSKKKSPLYYARSDEMRNVINASISSKKSQNIHDLANLNRDESKSSQIGDIPAFQHTNVDSNGRIDVSNERTEIINSSNTLNDAFHRASITAINNNDIQWLMQNLGQVISGRPNTPQLLDIAITNQNVEQVRIILEFGANVNYVNSALQTPLHIAAQRGNPGIVLLLIRFGASSSVVDSYGLTPIGYTDKQSLIFTILSSAMSIQSEAGDKETESDEINSKEHSTESKDEIAKKNELLYDAVKNNRMNDVIILLIKKVNVNRHFESQTVLGIAVKNLNFEMVSLLIDVGANVNAISRNYRPLALAIKFGQLEIVKLLISKGADVTLMSSRQKSMMYYASKSKDSEIMKELQKHGADESMPRESDLLENENSSIVNP